jgi:hypothetical protein
MNAQSVVKSRILTTALALGLAFDILFYDQMPGLSVLLFVLLVLSVLTSLGKLGGIVPKRQNLWLLLPLIFFAAMVAVRANPYLNALNVAACLLLLGLLAYFYAAGRLDRLGIVGYYISPLIAGVNAVRRTAPLIPEGLDVMGLKTRGARGARALLPFLRGLLLALPVAIVFVALLASADVVFANWIGSLLNMELPDVREVLWHVLLVLSVAWVLAGGLAFAISRGGVEDGESWESALDSESHTIKIGFIEGAVVLTVVNLIFMAFGWIQLSYLFGGQANIAADGFTYADYARRGFFELIAVSVLTMGLILGLHNFTWRETRLHTVTFRALATSMVVFTGILLTSAFYRMWMYEEAYGFTHLRLAVHVFEVWLALLFIWLVFTLWRSPRRFAVGAFVAVLGFLATLNLINLDSTIAERNLARYVSTGKIDVSYLARLSEDAVPTLLANAPALKPDDRNWLLFMLNTRWQSMKQDESWKSIPSFNLGRWQAYSALEANSVILSQATPRGAGANREMWAESDYLLDTSGR